MHRVIAACFVFMASLVACGQGTQNMLVATTGTAVPDPSSSMANGDVNGDGVVDHKDMLLAQRIALGMTTASAAQLMRGDMHADGFIDVSDYLLIQKNVLGL